MMNLSRRLLVLSAITAISCGIVACGDDDDDKKSACQASCNGNIAISCVNGMPQQQTCQTPYVCSAGQCVPPGSSVPTAECTVATCSNNSVINCVGGTLVPAAPCQNPTPYCSDGQCIQAPACDPASFQPTCIDGKRRTCVNGGSFEDTACPTGQTCSNGSCVASGNGGGSTTPVVSDTAIGAPCQCPAGNDSCLIKITGAELNGALTDTVTGILGDNKLADTDVVEAPNFFSQSITGCEALANSVPDGMAVGCLSTQTIKFPAKIAQYATVDYVNSVLENEKLATIGGLIKPLMESINLEAIFAKINPLFTNGITFTSNNGYCIAAAIDIKATLGLITMGVKDDAFKSLLSKITVGDHSRAMKASCPAGSTHLSYTLSKSVSLTASQFDVGFDLCLKTCNTDADCRASEGYGCIEIPNGDASNNYAVPDPCKDESYDKNPDRFPKQKVCFDKTTKAYFEKMTTDFQGLLPEKSGCK